ncbi:MAG TPA: dCTP deaminase [Flavobacterium sp.]|nr:dCTP deaminase [Flavobacterium sp.]
MILTDTTILKEMENGNIVVEPFFRENLGTNSIDLTLAPEILYYTEAYEYLFKKNMYGFKGNCNLLPLYKEHYLDAKKDNATKKFNIDEEGFLLNPGMLYIASTNEYTETHNAVPKLEGKSSIGRLGLFVHVTAGYGDVGFCGKWTLELVATVPIKIYPNMKICQISYHGISEPPLVKYGDKKDNKYQNQDSPTASMMHKNFDK